MKRYAYVITRTDDTRAEEDRVMSRGTQQLEDGQDPRAFAEDRLRLNRTEHSHYRGPRRIAYWPFTDEAPLPRTAPAGAEHIDG